MVGIGLGRAIVAAIPGAVAIGVLAQSTNQGHALELAAIRKLRFVKGGKSGAASGLDQRLRVRQVLCTGTATLLKAPHALVGRWCLAGIADTVAIAVGLIRVRSQRTVVNGVIHTVTVTVGSLLCVGTAFSVHRRPRGRVRALVGVVGHAVIVQIVIGIGLTAFAGITHAVAVVVGLIRIRQALTVVAGIGLAVAIQIAVIAGSRGQAQRIDAGIAGHEQRVASDGNAAGVRIQNRGSGRVAEVPAGDFLNLTLIGRSQLAIGQAQAQYGNAGFGVVAVQVVGIKRVHHAIGGRYGLIVNAVGGNRRGPVVAAVLQRKHGARRSADHEHFIIDHGAGRCVAREARCADQRLPGRFHGVGKGNVIRAGFLHLAHEQAPVWRVEQIRRGPKVQIELGARQRVGRVGHAALLGQVEARVIRVVVNHTRRTGHVVIVVTLVRANDLAEARAALVQLHLDDGVGPGVLARRSAGIAGADKELLVDRIHNAGGPDGAAGHVVVVVLLGEQVGDLQHLAGVCINNAEAAAVVGLASAAAEGGNDQVVVQHGGRQEVGLRVIVVGVGQVVLWSDRIRTPDHGTCGLIQGGHIRVARACKAVVDIRVALACYQHEDAIAGLVHGDGADGRAGSGQVGVTLVVLDQRLPNQLASVGIDREHGAAGDSVVHATVRHNRRVEELALEGLARGTVHVLVGLCIEHEVLGQLANIVGIDLRLQRL